MPVDEAVQPPKSHADRFTFRRICRHATPSNQALLECQEEQNFFSSKSNSVRTVVSKFTQPARFVLHLHKGIQLRVFSRHMLPV
jgi:hypothetical protein